jgi:hypothetical protein
MTPPFTPEDLEHLAHAGYLAYAEELSRVNSDAVTPGWDMLPQSTRNAWKAAAATIAHAALDPVP